MQENQQQSQKEKKQIANASEDSDDEKKLSTEEKKRRARNDGKNRDFSCGCGKTYLSYPALYTHLKQKHDGKAPTGTNIPQNNGKGKKGRPKNEEKNPQLVDSNLFDEQSSLTEEDSDPLDELLYFLKTLGRNLKREDITPKDNELIIQAFPTDILKNQENLYKPVMQELQTFLQMTEQQIDDFYQKENEEAENQENKIKSTKINQILAIFLYELSRFVLIDCFKEIAYFVCLYRLCLNQHGWDQLEQSTDTKVDQNMRSQEFCAVNSGEYAVDICNKFIIDCLPEYLDKFEFDSNIFTVIGKQEDKLKNTQQMTKHFCNWLNFKKYTNSKLSNTLDDEENYP